MEYLKPFLIGGTIIAGAKYISTKVNPAYAAMVAGMPSGIIASYFLSDDAVRRKFYGGYAIADIIVAIVVGGVSILTHYKRDISVNHISFIGYIIWLVLTFLSIKLFSKKIK